MSESFIPQVWVDAIAKDLTRESTLFRLMDERDEYEKAVDRERYRAERATSERAKAELWDGLQDLNHGALVFGSVMGPVLELHAPTFDDYPDGRCGECVAVYSWGGEAADWPCATITTLAEAVNLGHIADRIDLW